MTPTRRREDAAAYDEVAYPSLPYPAAHPSRMAAVARLHGLSPPAPATCRYLDIACGEGANPLGVAASLPGSTCVGFDLSPTAVARGAALRDAAGLDRVELRVGDLRDAVASGAHGSADYIVIHGLISWAEEDVRDAALALAARLLAPGGIVLVSYNALPGWHLLRPARELARHHAAREPADPQARAAAARAALALARELHGESDAYGAALTLAAERYERADPSLLFHDDLADVCVPHALTDVVELGGRHGLRYLDEALPDHWWQWRLAPTPAERLRDAVGSDDPVALQHQADLASGVIFKATLFVADSADPEPVMDPGAALDLHAAAATRPPEAPPGEAPAVAAAMDALDTVAPATLGVSEVAERAALAPETAARAVLRLTAEHRATLSSDPPAVGHPPGERPEASPLARAQAAAGDRVTTLRHETISFAEPLGRALLQLLDGTRERDPLTTELAARARELGVSGATRERVAASLEGQLDQLGRLALVRPDNPGPSSSVSRS